MKPLPLRTSLTLAYTGMLALLLAVLAFGYHSTLILQLDADATESLQEKARGLHGYLKFDNGSPVLMYDQDDPDEAAFIDDATRYYQVYDASDGRMLVQSPGLAALGLHYTPAEVAEFRDNPGSRDIQTDRGRLRLSTSVIAPSASEIYVVQVGELLDRIDGTLVGFNRFLLWRVLIGLACAAVMGRWLAGRALAPLAQLAHATRAIDVTNLRHRLSVRGANDEIDEVALAFNRALDRVEHSVGEMQQFSAALAHELRTPLAILRGQAELALRHTLSADEIRHQLASQIEEFDRLTRLINQILTLARADAGEIKMARQPVDLTALGATVAEQIEPVAAARGITLTSQVADGVAVAGDAAWLERLLLILLDNAIKFTPEGGRVAITVSGGNGLARIGVADTGAGISPEARPRLFDRFFRADPARSQQTPGAGLGLALAKWIADRHAATIEVNSQPAHGSTFTLTMPALSAPLSSINAS